TSATPTSKPWSCSADTTTASSTDAAGTSKSATTAGHGSPHRAAINSGANNTAKPEPAPSPTPPDGDTDAVTFAEAMEVLGLKADERDPAVIRIAYLAKIRASHPDINSRPSATGESARI